MIKFFKYVGIGILVVVLGYVALLGLALSIQQSL
jgi:hypothetical protein